MIPVAAYTAAETPNAIQLAGQLPKLSLPVGGSRPHVIHGSVRPTQVSPQTAS